MNIASSKGRLLQYLDIKGISKVQFYRETQIKRGFLDADKLNASISDKFLAIIVGVYSDLKLSWLITGAGEMEHTEATKSNAVWVDYNNFKLVPLVGKRARAGFLAGWEDEEYIEELPKIPWEVDKEYKGNYLTFEAVGDSMESINSPRESIYEGDLLLAREVDKHHWSNKLHINQWDFIIVHKEEGILVKRIIEHDVETGKLVLHSLNNYYQDQTVYMNDLVGIYNVIDIKRSRRR